MSDETKDLEAQDPIEEELTEEHTDYQPVGRFDAAAVHHLSGMYKTWFLDYASSTILDRAVPHIEDGLKPVQRRILHSMKRMDDGRYNKVANIVGHTMQFHPHGDASIGDALVQLGQKNLLVDPQGNWGNILTGDPAAAPRYIEARLSKFALDVVFNPKTTEWQLSYDGRNKEPITLPVKFPLLLAQGAEGIAVGLSSKILPHNFTELCDASISYLRGEEFHLYPDFPTGGSVDVSKYNDGLRGGSVKVRAKIEKLDAKTLVIREIPFGKTAGTLKDSILAAVEKGKIKVKRVDDMTSSAVEIQVHLQPGISADKTIDALYAFTDCEVSISPNCCVIEDNHPRFITVSEVLRHNTDHTKALLKQELEIRKAELEEQLFFASLERIFIEERIYKDREFEKAETMDIAIAHVDKRLDPFKPELIREVTRDDILRLMEIKMQRILKFSKDKAEELIARIQKDIKDIKRDLAHMTDVTIQWYEYIKEKYGAQHPRLTELRNFDTIVAAKVAEANQKLYINTQEGFIGTGLKKDKFVCNCSDIDDIIIFYRDGKYKVIRVAEKVFVGKNVIHLQVFKRNDSRTTYNVVYRDGKQGRTFIKRFNVTAITRDREYDLTKGTPGSRILYFTANPNGEAEIIKVQLEEGSSKRKTNFDKNFSDVPIKGRGAAGLQLTKYPVQRIGLKQHGHSTLGGLKVWFDEDVNRLNFDERGRYLGEFSEDDQLLVILKNYEYYFTNFDPANHYEDNILRIEKFQPEKVWTLVLHDADNQGFLYAKRFLLESARKRQNLLGENTKSQCLLLTDEPYPRIEVVFAGADSNKEPLEIELEEFIGVKGYKAKGKRITTLAVEAVNVLPPTRQPEPAPESQEEADTDDSLEEPDEQITPNQSGTPDNTETTEQTETPAATEPVLTIAEIKEEAPATPPVQLSLFDDEV